MIRTRLYDPADREFVLSLAPRLAIGLPLALRSVAGRPAAAAAWVLTTSFVP
jgi:hypothetical protein